MLFLATELWRSHGGIQRYGYAVANILASGGYPLNVVSYLDRDVDRPKDLERFSAVCCDGSKMKFVSGLLRLARNKNRGLLIVGHVAFLPIAWLLKRLGLIHRYVVIIHGVEAWKRLGWIYRIAARSAESIVAPTRYTALECSRKNGVDLERFAVIPPASVLPLRGFQRRAPETTLRLLCVTRLVAVDRYKGVDTVLRAVRLARANGMRVTLDVVGQGDDEPRLKAAATEMAIEDLVTFRGAVLDSELELRFQQADVFVLPSKKEGFGIVYLEAMAAGLPCIGANHGGAPEVIDHGQTGFLIEYGDVRQLVFFLEALKNSPALYDSMASAAYRKARSACSFAAMARSWKSLLARADAGTTHHEDGYEPARS